MGRGRERGMSFAETGSGWRKVRRRFISVECYHSRCLLTSVGIRPFYVMCACVRTRVQGIRGSL